MMQIAGNCAGVMLLIMLSAICAAGESGVHNHKHHKHDAEHNHDHGQYKQHNPDAHLHGHAELNLVQQGRELWVQLRAPAADIVGFEQAPVSAAEKQAVETAKGTLTAVAQWLSFAGADCRLHSAAANVDTGHTNGHAEFSADFAWSCNKSPSAVLLGLGELFPSIESVQVTWITDAGQGAKPLQGGSGKISLR